MESVGAITGLPLTNSRFGISTSIIDGVTLPDEEQDRLTFQIRVVTPDYFKTMQIPVKQGRGFTTADRMGSQPVLLLNETAAQRLWPGGSALGHQMEIGTSFGMGRGRASGTVVGVVADVREYGPASRPAPTLFLAHGQWPVDSMTDRREEPRRAVGVDRALARLAARAGSRRPDVCGPIAGADSRHAVAQPRLYMVLIGCFAITAMLLAAIGLYGVLAYAVGQRTREIGIRLALGARRGEVLRMVMSQAGKLVVVGVALGLVAAVLASRLLRAQLFEVAPTDTVTYVLVATGLLIVSLLASWIPARRASRIDPMSALRQD